MAGSRICHPQLQEIHMALSISRTAFIPFLVNAKRQTYAAQGDDATVTPLLPGSRQLEYREGVLLYRDINFGIVADYYGKGNEVRSVRHDHELANTPRSN